MIMQNLRLHRAILGAVAVIGTAAASVLFAAPATANPPPPTITFTGGVLTITGTAANDGLIVGSTTAGGTTLGTITLNGVEVLEGSVPVQNVTFIRVDGGAGHDTVTFDESNDILLPPGEIDGGPGNDNLTGGSAIDIVTGSDGIDRIDGGRGADIVSMGAGADQFTFNTGDGNDHLDGDGDKDTLLFNSSATVPFFTEFVDVKPDGNRTTLRRSQPTGSSTEILDVMSVGSVELVKMNLSAGPTDARVNSVGIRGTGSYMVMKIDLGSFVNPEPELRNSLSVVGTEGPDLIRIASSTRGTPAAGLTMTGLGGAFLVTGSMSLFVSAEGGDDVIDAGGLDPGIVDIVRETGGPGNNTLRGHPGNDVLLGDAGDDRLEGRGGVDILDGGGGNDVIIP